MGVLAELSDAAHYPLAFDAKLREVVTRAEKLSGGRRNARWDETVKHLDRLLDCPLVAYRPLPAARRFHQSDKHYRWAIGGNRCLGPDTLIDRPDGPPRRVADITGEHEVWAWDGRKQVRASAGAPWVKAFEPCYRLHLTGGRSVDVSAAHLILTPSGYASVGDLIRGTAPCLRPTSSGTCPRGSPAGVPRWTRTPSGSPAGCRPSVRPRLRGGRPVSGTGTANPPVPPPRTAGLVRQPSPRSCPPPRPDGVPGRTFVEVFARGGARGSSGPRTLLRSVSVPLSTPGGPPRPEAPAAANELRAICTVLKPSDPHSRVGSPPTSASGLRLPPTCVSDLRATSAPFLSTPLVSPFGESVTILAYEPLGVKPIYDFEVPGWHNYVAGGVVHHNSSKSESVAVEVCWFATGIHPFRDVVVPNVGWYSTQTWEMVGEILWEKTERLLRPFVRGGTASVVWHNKQRNIPAALLLTLPDGRTSRVIFKCYEQGAATFQGTERRYVADDEQFGQPIYTEQISRIGAETEELDFFAALTPIIPQPWLEERLTVAPPPAWEIVEYDLEDNRLSRGGFIADAKIDALIEEWPEEVRPTRTKGRWGSFMGSVYKTFSRTTHVVTEAEERLLFPKGRVPPTCVGAIDFGAADPLAFLWGCKLPAMPDTWYIFDEYWWDARSRGVRLIEKHAGEILLRTKRWGTSLLHTWADHDRQERHEYAAHGLPTYPARKDIILGIEAVQKMFQPHPNLLLAEGFFSRKRFPAGRPRLLVAARCSNFVREHVGYKWPDAKEGKRNAGELPVDVDNHTCDSARYLIYGETTGLPTRGLVSAGSVDKRKF